MNLSENLENALSRSDAVVLVDRMRVLVNSAFEKNMTIYTNPFADAPEDADYFPSLMRLAYYQSSSFEASSITKTNELFYPLRHMSREEFIKVALTAFNIPQQSYNLAADFTDSMDMSVWAAKYFETAVYYGIVVGNNGQLLARDKINTREALTILARIQSQFGQNYTFDVNDFEEPVILEPISSYQKTIGVEYEPAYYKPEATPIKISNITTSYNNEKNYYVLTAVTSDLDIANGATDYYQWHTNAGYFLESPSSPNFKEVHFYPASSLPLSDYVISVSGWDDLGFVSYSGTTLSKSVFSYPEDQKAVAESEVGFDAFSALVDSTITATKAVTVDFSATHVTKSNLDLAIDHVVIEMLTGDEEYNLYSDTPRDKKATFIVPEIASLYGQEVTLRATMYIQNVKHQGTMTVQYLPVLMLTGRVYNSGDGPDAEYITIDGQHAYVDEDNRFFIKVDNSSEVIGGSVQVYSGSDANYFQPRTVDLTYQNPRISMVLIGRNKIIDRDLDGMLNEDDAFPDDPTEAYDFDSDGIGNNADTDDDNDGMPDDYEIMHGFNPYDPETAGEDADGDGFSNLEEYKSGTDPLDKENYPGSINNKSPWTLFLPAILNKKLNGDATVIGALNDTGITWSGNYESGNNTACVASTTPDGDNVVAAQDCSHGRDTTHNDDSDGHAGFSYTKLDSNGVPLANQNADYATTPWACVKDNVTGLIWEVKTDDGGLHDKDDSYNWYNTDPATNGGANGYDDYGGDSCYGYNSDDSSTFCNTEAYVNRVNAAGWCGASNWRMPTRRELESIVAYGRYSPAIAPDFFPNAVSLVWSWSPVVASSDNAWLVNFNYGDSGVDLRNFGNAVRLLRNGQ